VRPPGPATTVGPAELLDGLLEWAGTRLATPLSVAGLAAHLGISPRTLARRFADQLGTAPGAWLLARRVAAARTLLEETGLPVEAIAARVGLTSAVNLRRRFRARVGTTPGRLPASVPDLVAHRDPRSLTWCRWPRRFSRPARPAQRCPTAR
jgi:AraC family transcriptional activator FtrA